MKNFISSILHLVATSVTLMSVGVYASAAGGGDTGGVGTGGGAGVEKDGQYMTFYTAGLYVKPINTVTELPKQVPEINDLYNFISQLTSVPEEIKNQFLAAVLPTSVRQYHIASPDALTPAIYARLQAEFQRVTGVDTTQITLFAITDIPQKTTYLLPPFEKLSHEDKMAILFHEAYWLVFPKATYNQVVNVEMAFEALMKSPNDAGVVYDFLSKGGFNSHVVDDAFIKWDINQGNLKGFLNRNNEVSLTDLFGDEFVKCMVGGYIENCSVKFRKHLSDLMQKYPKSMILNKMAAIVDQDERNFYFVRIYNRQHDYHGVGVFVENELSMQPPLTRDPFGSIKNCSINFLDGSKSPCSYGITYYNGSSLFPHNTSGTETYFIGLDLHNPYHD